jgi:alpha-amylase
MGSPVEAFAVFSRILSDLEARMCTELEKPDLAAKRLLRRLPAGMGFTFSYDFVRSSGLSVHNLQDFCSALKTIDVSSIEYHIERGDFERWVSQVVGDNKLANDLANINSSKRKLKGEILRKKVLSLTEKRLKQLSKITDIDARRLKKKKK